jgi:hypothetical protein
MEISQFEARTFHVLVYAFTPSLKLCQPSTAVAILVSKDVNQSDSAESIKL